MTTAPAPAGCPRAAQTSTAPTLWSQPWPTAAAPPTRSTVTCRASSPPSGSTPNDRRSAMDEPRFQHLYDMRVELEPPQIIGQTPQGNRQIFYVRSGTFEGPRLKGELLPGGGDW